MGFYPSETRRFRRPPGRLPNVAQDCILVLTGYAMWSLYRMTKPVSEVAKWFDALQRSSTPALSPAEPTLL